MTKRFALNTMRASPAVLVLPLIALTGCTDVSAETAQRAESGLAVVLKRTLDDTSELLSTRASLDAVSTGELAAALGADLRPDSQTGNVMDGRGVYSITTEPAGSTVFSVFFVSSAFGSGGLVTTNITRHSCGTLSGTFSDPAVIVADTSCPPEVAARAGSESREVSLTTVAENNSVQIQTR